MKKLLSRSICAASVLAVLAGASLSARAWDKWEAFKESNVNESFRVVDYSDSRRITTSEGQSYAMFFALVAGDKDSFEKLLKWTENNLADGDITKHKPSWLWGRHGSSWGVIDSNNAADSDMWIAYCLLEAGRLWNRPDYTDKGRAMMNLLKNDVRYVKGLGKVLLPGYKGFEQENFVTLNPSYYPVFIMRRFALEDPDWGDVVEGTVRSLVRSAPRGYAPDWVRFDRQGKVIAEKGDDYVLGSYNAIRTYMWAAMMSPADPARDVLVRQFEPFAKLTRETNMPPEKINIVTGERKGYGSPGFAACVLELLGKGPTQDYLRTVIENDPIIGENYYRNTLLIYAIGFDRGLYRFDRDGHLILSSKTELTAVPPKAAAPAPEAQTTADEAGDAQSDKAPEAAAKPQTDKPAKAQPAPAPVKAEPAKTQTAPAPVKAEPAKDASKAPEAAPAADPKPAAAAPAAAPAKPADKTLPAASATPAALPAAAAEPAAVKVVEEAPAPASPAAAPVNCEETSK